MNDRELPSDSDSSDEDFVPEGIDSDLPSEEESSPDDNELEGGVCSGDESKKEPGKGKKRASKKKGGAKKKRLKKRISEPQFDDTEVKQEIQDKPKVSEEDEKKKADSLWADFMKDVGGRPAIKGHTPKVDCSDSKVSAKIVPEKSVGTPKEKENKVTVTQLFEFAGEEVRVTKEVDAGSAEARLQKSSSENSCNTSTTSGRGRGRGGLSGIASVLGQIGKKSKISTLEKSKLDWESYKQKEGIQEEIQTHNRGKEGYLERQDFLERTDFRQFEIEKQLRATRRSNR